MSHKTEAEKYVSMAHGAAQAGDEDAATQFLFFSDSHAQIALVEAQEAANEQASIANLIALGLVGGGPINNVTVRWNRDYVRTEFPDVARDLGIGGAE